MPKFKAGDKVICRSRGAGFHVGELGIIVRVDPDDDKLDIHVERLKDSVDWWENSENFELYEEPAPEYKTEHRPAKVGEYVKVLSEDGHHAKKDSILKVREVLSKNWVNVIINEHDTTTLRYEQYDVVLNYKPEPAADPEPTYKTEHRKAKEGEYVIIINMDGHNFAVGDICKASSGGSSLLNAECVKGSRVGLGQYLREDNYDVLIDYDPSAASAEPSTAASTTAKPTSKREHDEHRKVRVRFKKSKYKTLEGGKAYRKNRAQIDNLDGCTVIVIGDSGVLFNLDYGVFKVDLRYCELF